MELKWPGLRRTGICAAETIFVCELSDIFVIAYLPKYLQDAPPLEVFGTYTKQVQL